MCSMYPKCGPKNQQLCHDWFGTMLALAVNASIWIVNELGLIWVKSGHEAPEGPFYTVKGDKFYVGGHEIDDQEKMLHCQIFKSA